MNTPEPKAVEVREMKRRNSFDKMQQQLGAESEDAAAVAASQMHNNQKAGGKKKNLQAGAESNLRMAYSYRVTDCCKL